MFGGRSSTPTKDTSASSPGLDVSPLLASELAIEQYVAAGCHLQASRLRRET